MLRGVTSGDLEALAEFRYQIRCFLSFSERAARSVGLEPQQHQLLLAITGLPVGVEPTIGELADRLQLQHHSTVELINRTEQRNLVKRQRSDVDRRQVFVRVTEEGEGLLQELSAAHWAELRSSGPQLVSALWSVTEGENNFDSSPTKDVIEREGERD